MAGMQRMIIQPIEGNCSIPNLARDAGVVVILNVMESCLGTPYLTGLLTLSSVIHASYTSRLLSVGYSSSWREYRNEMQEVLISSRKKEHEWNYRGYSVVLEQWEQSFTSSRPRIIMYDDGRK